MIKKMKNKGFTMIELLAVIVIIAVITLIAIPQVMKLIYDVRLKAAENSAYGIIDATEHYIMDKILLNGNASFSELIEFKCNKNNCSNGNDILKYDGSKAVAGKVIIGNQGNNIALEKIMINGFTCNKGLNEDLVYCGKETGEIVDKHKGIICGEGSTEDYDNVDKCYIKSIEDYKEFYTLVNSGKNFQNKTVYLMKDLDLVDEDDIEPIGNSSSNPFSGTFKGNAYSLSNINIEGTSNIGIFGYVNGGKIEGINIENVNITATSNNVGGLVGYLASGTINEVTITGNIKSNGENVGGLVGYSGSSSDKLTSILVNANVTGNANVGGIVGYNYSSPNIVAVVEGGTIKATNSGYGYGGKIVGNTNGYRGTAYASTDVILSKWYSGVNGTSYEKTDNILSMYDEVLDTYIGGDNDSSGNYYDYDEEGKIVLLNVEEKPITFTLSGEGTEENPYIINNELEWKQATTKLNKYYILNNDLDYTNKKYYSLGTQNNIFSGNLIGQAHTIRNVSIQGYGNVGLVGYMSGGKIEGINIENINITATGNNVGGLVGYLNSGTINEVTITGNIKSNGENAGGLVGYSGSGSDKLTSILANANVTGNANVGGLVGYNYSSPNIVAVVEGGTIKATNSGYGYGGKIVGNTNGYIGTAYASTDVILSASFIGRNGTSYSKTDNILSMYDEVLDTYVGGDNDSSGNYYDYDEEGKIVLLNVEENPITFTLSGEGTEEDPYIINNELEWKQATTKLNKYYILNNDLDYENKKYYSLGTQNNIFRGSLIGQAHTIRNVSIEGYGNVGLVGYMDGGKIEGINIENVNITATSNNVGGLVGYLNSGMINEVTINGNIKSNGENVGGLVGYSGSSSDKLTSILVNANVTGNANVGGLVGYNYSSPNIVAVVEGGTIKATNSGYGYGGKIVGNTNGYIGTAYASTDVILSIWYNGVNGTSYDASHVGDLSYYETLKSGNSFIIETTNTGDYNNSGYIFGYKNVNGVNKIQVIKVG